MWDISPSLPEKEVRILVQSDSSDFQTIGIQYYTKSQIVTAQADFEYEDIVDQNDQNCYKYRVKEPTTTLSITAHAYSGNPDIYVNPT